MQVPCFAGEDGGGDSGDGGKDESKQQSKDPSPQLFPNLNATRENERNSLTNLYNATQGSDGWFQAGGWLDPDLDHCLWEGVVCNLGGLVTELSLPNNGLAGELPSIDAFQSLRHLDLHSNELTAKYENIRANAVPSLKHIDLAKNGIGGTLGEIPGQVTYIDLGGNNLEGTIHQKGASKLVHLSLSDNLIEAANLTRLSSLQYLDLSGNEGMDQPLSNIGLRAMHNLTRLDLARSPFTGELHIGHTSLEYLDLNGIGLSGVMKDTGVMNLTSLTYIDLGGNEFSGHFDFCNFTSPEVINLQGNGLSANLTEWSSCQNLTTLRYCDLSRNNFTGQMKDTLSQAKLLEWLDVHGNEFYGELLDIALPSLKHINVADNHFRGPLFNLTAPFLRYINCSYNSFVGRITPFLYELRLVETIDLSHQLVSIYDEVAGERVTTGLTGALSEAIGDLPYLQLLSLSNNLLSGSMPSSLATLTYLKTLDLHNNQITSSIPPAINVLEQLDSVLLSHNQLAGAIPDLSGAREKIRTVTLSGNPDLSAPAPYTLCDLEDLDLREDDEYCPRDRSALAAFYSATLGTEWLNNTNWLTDEHHCDWYGVGCNEDNSTVLSLSLPSNGLAGIIPTEFVLNLPSLEKINLNDNDLRGDIPSGLGEMKSLTYLRLSYNRFTKLPKDMDKLQKLSFVHLQGNRLTGDISNITVLPLSASSDAEDSYRFISDCGSPSDAAADFTCTTCDMCCNSLEECQTPIVENYSGYEKAGLAIAFAFAFLVVLWAIIRVLVKRKKISPRATPAINATGRESVYSFFLAKNKIGWVIASFTVGIQVAVFSLFLSASEFSNDDGDFVYSFRCPLNSEECGDERAVSSFGWVMWGFLVFASLLDDIVSGIKLVLLSSSRGSKRCFIGGTLLFCVTVLAVYTSAAYNKAIAMTNTELIVNAVILLFVNDVDEQVFNIVCIINSSWLGKLEDETEAYSAKLLEADVSEDAEDAKELDINATLESPRSVSTAPETARSLPVNESPTGASTSESSVTNEELLRQMQLLREQVFELQKWRANEDAVMGILGGGMKHN